MPRRTTRGGQRAKVTISERQKEILEEFSHSRTEPFFLRQRATVILLAFAGQLNEQIATEVALDRHQVGVWRTRWTDAFS
jgi:putative transposase